MFVVYLTILLMQEFNQTLYFYGFFSFNMVLGMWKLWVK